MRSLVISSIVIVSLAATAVACRDAAEDDALTSASQSRLAPAVVDGNPTCASLGLGTAFVKNEGATNGVFALSGDATATVSNANGNTFDWTATIGVDAVIVKGGPNANVYRFDPESMGGTGLHAPVNPANGKFYGLSHIDFCFDVDVDVPEVPDAGCTGTGCGSSGTTPTPDAGCTGAGCGGSSSGCTGTSSGAGCGSTSSGGSSSGCTGAGCGSTSSGGTKTW